MNGVGRRGAKLGVRIGVDGRFRGYIGRMSVAHRGLMEDSGPDWVVRLIVERLRRSSLAEGGF